MPVALEIEDGVSHWWLSPDVWTVPIDPLGAKGAPIVGKPCYLWARVHNKGNAQAVNATVNFYWANPAGAITRNTATKIGTSSATVNANGQTEVLCLTAWLPIFVNGGHECVLAEAFLNGADPLPAGPDFNVPTDRHVAQRNLSVVMAAEAMFHFAFEIHNDARIPRRFSVRATPGNLKEVRELVATLNPKLELPREDGTVQGLGFVTAACPTPEQQKTARPSLDGIEIGPFQRQGFTLVGRLEKGAALVHIEQQVDKQLVGGLSVLVVPAGKEAGQ
jgi:hypothetical protein